MSMTPTDLDLARRWAASPLFKWRPGMRGVVPGHDGWAHRTDVGKTRGLAPWYVLGDCPFMDDSDMLPDLSDPMTRLALLLDVREAWGDEFINCAAGPGNWVVLTVDCGEIGMENTETEALVAALEAAPSPEPR